MPAKFVGTYQRALDAKCRLLLPPSYLQALGLDDNEEGNTCAGSFWLTSFYGRLVAYRPEHWLNTVEQLCKIRLPSQKLSNFKTKLIGLAQELTPDAQGRVRIPQSLMREAGLHKEVVLVGILDKFEIWDQERFDAVPLEDVTDELAASGIEISL